MGLRCWKRYSCLPMHRVRVASAALAVVLLTGCTDTADVFPMNAAAHQLGPVQVSFVRTGTGRGPVTIKMADGA
jgi:outer membrane biogenesis lipoprotein LolB